MESGYLATILKFEITFTHVYIETSTKQFLSIARPELQKMAESATEIKLFGKWSLDDIEIQDISLVVSWKSNR